MQMTQLKDGDVSGKIGSVFHFKSQNQTILNFAKVCSFLKRLWLGVEINWFGFQINPDVTK